MEKQNNVKSNIVMEDSEFKKKSLCILKGCTFAIIISIILLTVYALLLTYTKVSESTITPVVLTITGISILIGSTISSRKIKKNGLMYGGLVGAIYIIFLYFASSLCITGFSLTLNSLIMLAVGIITGIAGGIIGVNMR